MKHWAEEKLLLGDSALAGPGWGSPQQVNLRGDPPTAGGAKPNPYPLVKLFMDYFDFTGSIPPKKEIKYR